LIVPANQREKGKKREKKKRRERERGAANELRLIDLEKIQFASHRKEKKKREEGKKLYEGAISDLHCFGSATGKKNKKEERERKREEKNENLTPRISSFWK